jgi:NhaA family Na+:H+ antiporter
LRIFLLTLAVVDDLIAIGIIAFTVSLLIAELSFGRGSNYGDQATTGILAVSLIASLLAGAVLLPRNRHYRQTGSAKTCQRGRPGWAGHFYH